jgi:hypothetical protein
MPGAAQARTVASMASRRASPKVAELTWLRLRGRGATPGTAGNLLALMGLGNFAAALLVPVVAQRLHGQRVLAVSCSAAGIRQVQSSGGYRGGPAPPRMEELLTKDSP